MEVSTQRLEQLTVQADGEGEVEVEQRVSGLQQLVESLQQQIEQRLEAQQKALQEAQQSVQPESIDESKVAVYEQRLDQLEQAISGLTEQLKRAPEQAEDRWQELEQKIETMGLRTYVEEKQVLHNDDTLIVALQQQAAQLEQSVEQLQAASNQQKTQSSAVTGATSDGREKSIIEELRYEIGEVKKSNSRQLDALNSKLHTLSTSSEVTQIVKHATMQMQQKIEGLKQQVEKAQQEKSPVSTAIRF
jgi:signal transduction histidine kinase